MRALKVNVNESGTVTLHGKLPVIEYLPPDQTAISYYLSSLVKDLKEIGKLYKDLMSNDGRLIGQERVALSRKMENSICVLIQLRHVLEGDSSINILNLKTRGQIQISIHGDTFNGQGYFGRSKVRLNHEKFSRWLNHSANSRLKYFIHTYANASEDGIIDSKELADLNRQLDTLVIGFLLSRESIMSASMD